MAERQLCENTHLEIECKKANAPSLAFNSGSTFYFQSNRFAFGQLVAARPRYAFHIKLAYTKRTLELKKLDVD
jgi:hypothetical protein